jgi:hypothetical protein
MAMLINQMVIHFLMALTLGMKDGKNMVKTR